MSRLVPLMVSLLLACSALLKASELWDTPASHLGGILLPRWVSAAGIGIEAAVALALIFHWRPRQVQVFSLMLFVFFSATSAWLTFSGVASCGCFGRLIMPPWVTLVLDLAVVAALIWSLKRHCLESYSSDRMVTWRPVTAVLAAFSLALLLQLHRPEINLSTTGGSLKVGAPLEAQVHEGAEGGHWIVVCYRSDCPHCSASMADWLEWASLDQESNGRRWAFLNVDDEHTSRDLLDDFPHAKSVRWRKPMPNVVTPLVLEMRDGIVVKKYRSIEDFLAN